MDRTGITAVTIAILTLIGWTVWNQKEVQKVTAARAEVAKANAAAAEAEAKANPPAPESNPQAAAGKTADANGKPADAAGATPAEPAPALEKIEKLSGPSVEYAFSNLGGGIASATLKTHEAERGTRMVLNEFGSIPIGTMTEAADPDDKKTRLPFSADADKEARLPYSMDIDSANGTATFRRTDARQVEITKKFTVSKSKDLDKDYIVTLEVTFANIVAQEAEMPGYYIYTGSSAPVHQLDQGRYTIFTWAGGKFMDPNSFGGGWFSGPERQFNTASQQGIAWAAVADQYFTTMVIPKVTGQGQEAQVQERGNSVWNRRFAINDAAWKESGRATGGSSATRWAMDGAMGMPAFKLAPGKSFTQAFQIYAGPREYGRLRLMPDGETDVLNYGTFALIIRPVHNLLLISMNGLHRVLGSYALAIIVLTLVIKCILWPMQNKATQSMKRMQLLTPKMTELKEKYKDDPTRMNTELMKLYKTYGVNPLGGCLPMMIQLPVFWGFYSVLGSAVELRNSKFLWVQDLSQPDTVFHLPGLGYPVNVLPLLMAVTMFWQMRISPKSGDPSQQKMFMFMPLIFIAFCYNYASALALYLTVQNLFSVVQLYVTRNQTPPTLKKIDPPSKRK
jgi:YidC/Oxa1 family membrane protein insertase